MAVLVACDGFSLNTTSSSLPFNCRQQFSVQCRVAGCGNFGASQYWEVTGSMQVRQVNVSFRLDMVIVACALQPGINLKLLDGWSGSFKYLM